MSIVDVEMKSVRFGGKSTQASLVNKTTITSLKQRKVKIVVLGLFGSGKSSFVKRFMDNVEILQEGRKTMPRDYEDEIYVKNFYYKNDEWRLTIIDTPGQNEHTPFLQKKHLIGVNAFILFFAVNDIHSFEVIRHINTVLLESIGAMYIPRIVVGNKTDLEKEREVSTINLKTFAKEIKAPYVETSVKEGTEEEIDDVFTKLIKEIDKEANDNYPYNIKNSTIKMNFIRKNHKHFNFAFICLLAFITLLGSVSFVHSLVCIAKSRVIFNTYLIVNLVWVVVNSLTSVKGILDVRDQNHEQMNVLTGLVCLNIVMIILILIIVDSDDLSGGLVPDITHNSTIFSFFGFMLLFYLLALVINLNLQPLYKEMEDSTPLSQKLMLK